MTWYRWVILAVFSGIAFNCNMVVASFNALVDPMKTGFAVNEAWIIIMMTVPHIIYAPMSVVTAKMFQTFRSATVFRVAVLLMLVGSWTRIFAFVGDGMFWVLFLGNFIFVTSGPFVFNGLTLVIIAWYPEAEKSTATSIIGFGAQCGSFAGMAIPGVIAMGLDKTDAKADFNTVRSCILVADIISTFMCVMFLLVFRAKPKHYPSKIAVEAERRSNANRNSSQWRTILVKLCHNKNYICNATIFMIFWGIQSTMAVILTPLLSPGNYTTSELSLVGVCFVSGGMVFLFVYGIVLDRTRAYLTAARLISTVVIFCGVAAIWIIPAGNIVITCAWAFITGSFVLPIFTVCLPFTITLTHPIPSDAANGIMMTGSYIFATIGCLGGAALFEKAWYLGIFIFIGFVVIAFIASMLLKEPKPTVRLGEFIETEKEDEDSDL